MSRIRTRVALGFLALLVVIVGLTIVIDARRSSATLDVRSAGGAAVPGLEVEVADRDAADALTLGSRPASEVFDLAPDGPLETPAAIRFDIERVRRVDRPRLRVAHREGPSDMWVLRPVRVMGDVAVYVTRHFSQIQLRLLSQSVLDRVRRSGDDSQEALAVRAANPVCDRPVYSMRLAVEGAGADTPVAACLQESDGDGVVHVTIANRRSNGLEVSLPPGARVVRASGRSLTEGVWREVYARLGNDAAFVPGAGSATVAFDRVPAALEVSSDNAAMATDALIMAASAGRLGPGRVHAGGKLGDYAACVHSAARAPSGVGSVPEGVGTLRDLWSSCGARLEGSEFATRGAAFFGGVTLAAQVRDSLRDFRGGGRARVEVRPEGGGQLRAPSPGFAYRYDLEWDGSDGEVLRGVVELGPLRRMSDAMADGYDPQCFDDDESRGAVVAGRFELSHTADFDVHLVPELMPLRFERPAIFSSGSDGGRVTSDSARIETSGGCPQGSATRSMFGGAHVAPGDTFGPVDFRLLYPDVFTPAQPDGDPERIEAMALSLWPLPGGGLFGGRLRCLSGPGVGHATLMSVTGRDLRAVAGRYDLTSRRTPRAC